jgi:hypothetical protein
MMRRKHGNHWVKELGVVCPVASVAAKRSQFEAGLENIHYNIFYYMRFGGSGYLAKRFIIGLQLFRRQTGSEALETV